MDKKELRKKYLNIRNKIERQSKKVVIDLLKEKEVFENAKTVFCYVSAGSEPDTFLLLDYILKEGKTLAVPKCLDKKGNMAAVEINSLDDISEGFFGIREPKEGRIVEKEEIDLCIVPGLSFDKEGFRLGYGGGYYDRFLENTNIYTIGVCFEECVTDKLPREENDISVNEVISI